ncbi:hypothetical protein Tco_1060968 [Tanacetum coccineum]
MKHWKSGFFFIDRRAIPDAMVWRHPDAAIDDLRPVAGSFNIVDVCHLSTHVVKLRDIPEVMGIHNFFCLLEWTGVEVQEEPHLDVRPTLQRLPFYCTPLAAADAVIPEPASEDLALAKRTRSALAQSSASTTRPNLFVGDSDVESDDGGDAWNQGRSFVAPTGEGSNSRDSRGKGIMVDDAAAPSGGDGVAGNCEFTREEWDAPYRPIFEVITKEVCKDPAILSALKKQVSALNDKLSSSDASFAKSKVARLSAALNQATILEAERDEEILRLNTTPLEFLSFFRGQFQGLVRKFLVSNEFSRVQGELLSLAASDGFERGLSMHLTKDEFAAVLKKMVNFMSGAQERLDEASPLVAQTDYAFLNKISEYTVEPLSVILQLELEKLVRSVNVPIPRDSRVSPPIAKELTVTPVSKSLELSANVVPASSIVALEQNEEQVSATVDGSDLEMTDGAAHSKSGGSERVFYGLTDAVVALSASEKGDGSAPSSTVEEVIVPPSGV